MQFQLDAVAAILKQELHRLLVDGIKVDTPVGKYNPAHRPEAAG